VHRVEGQGCQTLKESPLLTLIFLLLSTAAKNVFSVYDKIKAWKDGISEELFACVHRHSDAGHDQPQVG